jgi:hypothetical protein
MCRHWQQSRRDGQCQATVLIFNNKTQRAAHRKSIIEKIEKSKTREHLNLTWTIFEG